jgi:hypothetical protein
MTRTFLPTTETYRLAAYLTDDEPADVVFCCPACAVREWNSSQERPRSLSGPLLPGPETRSLPRGCRYVSRPHGALKRETGASFKSLCFSWRTVKAFRQSNRHSLIGGADLYPDRVDSLRLHGSA